MEYATKAFVIKQVQDAAATTGDGDMRKSVYDTNGDGTVNSADSVPWTGVTGKPSTYTPEAHTHTVSQITDMPSVPDQLSDLADDATHRLVTDTEKATWNGKQDALGFTPVPDTRTINSKPLSADVTLTASDVGAAASSHDHASYDIIDFEAAVQNNTHVAANTAARHTHSNKAALDLVSGTNTGDQDLSGLVPKTTTVNGHALSANVTVTASDVGLGSVTNESKTTMFTSPALTGTPTAPTATSGTNTTQIATTAFVQSAVAAAGGGDMSKSTYDTHNKATDIFDYVDAVDTKVTDARNESLLRDLKIMLNLSLGTSSIDAWADLLNDSKELNLTSSYDVDVIDGRLKIRGISQTIKGEYITFGQVATSNTKCGQTFKTTANIHVNKITVPLWRSGTPTDNVMLKIYSTSAGLPSTLLFTSDTTISGNILTDSSLMCDFVFPNVLLSANTLYAIVLERSGALNSSNYYVTYCPTTNYSDGNAIKYNGSTWSVQSATSDIYFNIAGASSGSAVWVKENTIEPFAYAAISAEENLNTGSITYYLSDDGTNWTQITALDTSQAVNFDATSVYLKAVITGNAELLGIAWGGY